MDECIKDKNDGNQYWEKKVQNRHIKMCFFGTMLKGPGNQSMIFIGNVSNISRSSFNNKLMNTNIYTAKGLVRAKKKC